MEHRAHAESSDDERCWRHGGKGIISHWLILLLELQRNVQVLKDSFVWIWWCVSPSSCSLKGKTRRLQREQEGRGCYAGRGEHPALGTGR